MIILKNIRVNHNHKKKIDLFFSKKSFSKSKVMPHPRLELKLQRLTFLKNYVNETLKNHLHGVKIYKTYISELLRLTEQFHTLYIKEIIKKSISTINHVITGDFIHTMHQYFVDIKLSFYDSLPTYQTWLYDENWFIRSLERNGNLQVEPSAYEVYQKIMENIVQFFVKSSFLDRKDKDTLSFLDLRQVKPKYEINEAFYFCHSLQFIQWLDRMLRSYLIQYEIISNERDYNEFYLGKEHFLCELKYFCPEWIDRINEILKNDYLTIDFRYENRNIHGRSFKTHRVQMLRSL